MITGVTRAGRWVLREPNQKRSRRFLLFWQACLLDSRRVATAPGTSFVLPNGALVTIVAVEGDAARCEIAGVPVTLAAGEPHPVGELSLVLDPAPATERAASPLLVDANLLHTSMVVAAAQLCAVSALLFAPPSVEDMGGGITSHDLRRLMRHPADRAEHHGAPVMVAVGPRRAEAERIDRPRKRRGVLARKQTAPAPSVSEVLAELERVVNQGAAGYDLEASLGDISSLTPSSAELGEGAGGLLAPRPMLDDGVQSGLVGTGLDIHIQRPPKPVSLPPKPRRLALPALETPAPDDEASLLTQNRSEIALKVRERSAAVRYCYETRALQRDPEKTGRIVLQFSLRPDGYVDDVEVHATDTTLHAVAECVTRSASEWFLGAGLVSEPRRLAFPFVLQPRGR